MLDLSGKRYGRLVAIEPCGRSHDGNIVWKCQCDCGNMTSVTSHNLRSGHTRSCGCLVRDGLVSRNKKDTKFDLSGQFGIGYATNTGKKFIFDKEDFNLLKGHSWFENDQGYIMTSLRGRSMRMHRMLVNCKDGDIIDHRNRNRVDNRRCNLRIATRQLNGMNRGANKNSRTGVKGVGFDMKSKRYIARMVVDGMSIHLGTFRTQEEAQMARQKAEERYFGEFAYREEVVV